MKQVLMFTVLLSILVSTTSVQSRQFDFCVHGYDTTFAQVVSARLAAKGIDDVEDARKLTGELINRLAWGRQARSLDVLPDDAKTCRSAAGDRITLRLSVSPNDLENMRAELAAPSGSPTPGLDAIESTVKMSRLMSPSDEQSVQRLKVFYATNRRDRGAALAVDRYSGDRGSKLRYGTIDADIKTEPELKWLRALAVYKIIPALKPEKEVRVRSVTPMELTAWRQELASELALPGESGVSGNTPKPGVLLFIHGFSVSFKDAAMRTAQLAADLAFRGAPMFYSWPSKGNVGNYLADKESARASVIHLKSLLQELAALPGSPPVYVIAHSMGNEVLVSALQSLYLEANDLPASFKEIVLAAPDVDAERFETEHAKIIVHAQPRVTLYGSTTDLALNVSGDLQDARRLGDTNTGVTIFPPMDTIDATAAKIDFLGHSYYGDSQTVMSDLFNLIRNGLPPSERFGLVRTRAEQGGTYWKFK